MLVLSHMQMMLHYLPRLLMLCADCWVFVRITVESFLLFLKLQNVYVWMYVTRRIRPLVGDVQFYVEGKRIFFVTHYTHLGHVISAHVIFWDGGIQSVENWMIWCAVFGSVIRLLSLSWCIISVVIFAAAVYGICHTQALMIWVQHGARVWGDCVVYHIGHTVLCWHLCVTCCHLNMN